MNKETSIYVALDFPDARKALDFLNRNDLQGVPVKVGMELFYWEGPRIIERLKENGHPIFLDLKLHDIPTTVRKAMKNIAKLNVDAVTIHAAGGSEMISQAKQGLKEGGAIETKLLAVTILTSMNQHMMQEELNVANSLESQVIHLASISQKSGADGVICSVFEAEKIKRICGADFLAVTPGIRMENSSKDDQKRVATPRFARMSGADRLVIGRSITQAEDPKAVYERAIKEEK